MHSVMVSFRPDTGMSFSSSKTFDPQLGLVFGLVLGLGLVFGLVFGLGLGLGHGGIEGLWYHIILMLVSL